jgi:2',3'-cyclic-nucleotide 2'-phosphodiesterase (5'-nucleotidase family)
MLSRAGLGLVLSLLSLQAQERPKLLRSESKAITEAIPEDPDLAKVINPLKAEILATFGQVLVEAPEGLLRSRNGEENLLGYWVADAMRIRASQVLGTPVKFAITNSGGLRANLRPGPVKVGDITEVMPFENELVVAELTGAELLQVIREGIVRRGGEPTSGARARLGGTPERPEFTITWSDGSAINPKEIVKVATTDYLLASGDSMATIRKARNPVTTGLVVRQILLDACAELGRAKQPLKAPPTGRYQISAEMQQAIRDRKLASQE